LDLVSIPRRLGVDGPTSANIQLTREVARRLAYAIPFLEDATNGGDLMIEIDELSLPVVGSLRKMSGQGRLSVKDVTLVSGQVLQGEGFPRELTTQWQALSGDTSAAVKLNAPSVKFTIDNGRARHEPYAITLNDQSVMIAGETEMNGGKLAMQARLALSPQMQKEGFGEAIVVPISGTVEQPKMEVNSIASNISPEKWSGVIDRHIVDLRERKKERLLLLSDKQVKSITDPFDEIIRATTQASTRPSTRPATQRSGE
jgi:hypothetical protein